MGKNLTDEMVSSDMLEGASSGAAAGCSQADLIGCGGPGRTLDAQLTLRFQESTLLVIKSVQEGAPWAPSLT